MQWIQQILGYPLGWIMWLCYQITNSYGFALFLFTLITRLALFPMSLKQQKSTITMSMLRPQMEELQKKYKDNKEKLNEEMMKLYQKEGYNPMSGCLPLLIQMPILFGLIEVIYRPIKYILHFPTEVITSLEQIAVDLGLTTHINYAQTAAITGIHENLAQFTSIGQEYIDQIRAFNINFFGINLGLTPGWDSFKNVLHGEFSPLLLVPVLSGISALVMSLVSMKHTSATTGDAGAAAGASMKSMMLIMPIFSFTIAVTVPAGVGLYWFFSNLLALVQSLILNKFYNPTEMAEKAKREFEERQERERQERIEAKKQAKLNKTQTDEKAMTQKEINRRKLAEARRRSAEKYGEEYVEVTDDDLK